MFTTQRGRAVQTRPYATISLLERKAIVEESILFSVTEVCERWNISRQTLYHIKYHTVLVASVLEQVRLLKRDGKTSGEVAKILEADLGQINKVWSKV